MATSSSPSAKRIILHVGAQKTGSTSLQNQFHMLENRLRADGYFYAPRLVYKGQIHPFHWACVRIRREPDPDAYVEKGRTIIANTFRNTGAHTLIISNESLLGEPLTQANPHSFFTQTEFAAQKLAEMCAGYTCQVFFMARDWAQFIPSYYAQVVRQGSTEDFAPWAAKLDMASADWQHHARALISAFGANHVHIAFLEDGMPDAVRQQLGPQSGYYHRLALAAGLPQYDLPRKLDNKNTSPGITGLAAMRMLNRLMYRAGEGRKMRFFRRHILHKLAIHLLPKRGNGLQLEDNTALHSAYAAQKAAIKAMNIQSW